MFRHATFPALTVLLLALGLSACLPQTRPINSWPLAGARDLVIQ